MPRRFVRLRALFRAVCAGACATLMVPTADAQVTSPYEVLRNSVSNLHAEGDSLWIAPYLNLTTDGGQTWLVADADSLYDVVQRRPARGRVFSLDVVQPLVVAGLGYNGTDGAQAAGGFVLSEDGGATFAYRFAPIDAPSDNSVVYGRTELPAIALVAPEQSPPYDVAYDAARGVLYSANFFAGLRRSTDLGRTWERVVLPPDFLPAIDPDEVYASRDSAFIVGPRVGGQGHFNHMAFSVLVDETGTIWAGTLYGVNRSIGEPEAETGAVAWTRTRFDGSSATLTGSWVIAMEAQPRPGRDAIWMVTWPSDAIEGLGQFGATITRDGGETFSQTLVGERLYDFAFGPSGSDRVYAAGDNGLFISDDDGTTWRSITRFVDAARPDRVIRRGAAILSVATTKDAVWAGTSDGLLRSADGGETWQLFRTEVPTNPDVETARVPSVDAFAYPNPYSPALDDVLRIRFQQDATGLATARIFDFEMNLVRELTGTDESPGQRELLWDGRDSGGLRVANGPYFYVVDAPSGSGRGTILVLE